MISENLKNFVELARHHKNMWTEVVSGNNHDLPPTVIGFIDDVPQLMVVSPQVDKVLALQSVGYLRRGLSINQVVMVMDTLHVITKNKTEEQIAEIHARYRESAGNSMQTALEKGICTQDEIGEAISVICLDKYFKGSLISLPYKFADGKIEWFDDQMDIAENCKVAENGDEKEDGKFLSGYVFETLCRLMRQPAMADDPKLIEVINTLGFEDVMENREKVLFHTEVVMRKELEKRKYQVMECLVKTNNYEEFHKQMQHKYEACKKAKELDPIESFDEYIEMLDRKEEEMIRMENFEAVIQIRKMKEEAYQRQQENIDELSDQLFNQTA